MKKNNSSQRNAEQSNRKKIPTIDIIDLETIDLETIDLDSNGLETDSLETVDLDSNGLESIDLDSNGLETKKSKKSKKYRDQDDIEEPGPEDGSSPKRTPEGRGFHFNLHTVTHLALIAVAVTVVTLIAVRIRHWGNFISQNEIFEDGEGTYEDTFDQIFPALDAEGNLISGFSDGQRDILILGNSPFSDDRDSEDSLANMIAERTGANVINCSVSGSYMAAQHPYFTASIAPMDAYTPYWLCTLTYTDSINFYYKEAALELGNNTPPEAEDVFKILSNLDMNTIDVIAFMYDGTDYLMGHEMYSDENPTDIGQFTGNMAASIELIQERYPHIRIIVMSPTYAFGVDDNGEYISSDIKTYGHHFLSTYFNMQFAACYERGITFVDNLYGTINEDNASQYLTDNIHLNVEGRKLVADRFIYALTYFDG